MIALVLLAASAVVDIDERLNAQIPLQRSFTDSAGHRVKLDDYFHDGKPVLLVLAYFRCPMLCDLVLRGLAAAMTRQPLQLGKDFRALTVSIDPKDRPAEAALKQHSLLQAINRPGAEWPFLVGSEADVRALAESIGFQYAHDPKSDQYAHPACVTVLMPDGRVARYLYGVTYRPLDLRLAIEEAARGKVGGIVDRVLLTCFRYDPASRRYAWAVRDGLRATAALTLLALYLLTRRRRARP